jgi:alginate O-acetyltransferase complex protein AlgI
MSIFGLEWLAVPFLALVAIRFWLARREATYLGLVTAVSVGVLAWIQPLATLALFGLVVAVYATAHAFPKLGSRAERAVTLGILGLIGALLVGKYGFELFREIFPGSGFVEKHLLPPLGISYLCFRLVHYLIEAYRGTLVDKSFGRLLGYAFFLPSFPAGPIETFNGFHKGRLGAFAATDVAEGLWRISLGYFKKVVILGVVFGQFLDPRLNGPAGVHGAVADAFAPTFLLNTFFRAYLDLSAYSDLAIGFSRVLGFRIAENFHRPFAATNLGAFWNRWHMTLSAWCRNNVYFPVFGWTRKPWLGLYASMITMGLWHKLSACWLAWGVWHATGLTVLMHWGRFRRKNPKLDRLLATPAGTFFGWSLTMGFVAAGYAFVAMDNFRDALRLVGHGIRGLVTGAFWS